MSLRNELKIPFQGSAEPAKRLARGGVRLVGDGLGWVIAVPGEIPERAVGVLIGAGIIGSVATQFPMVSGTAGAVVAGVAAWRAGAPHPSKIDSDGGEGEGKAGLRKEGSPENDHETSGEGEEDEEPHELQPLTAAELEQQLPRFVEYAVAAAHQEQRAGEHLAELLAALHRNPRWALTHEWDVARLRKELETRNIPVSRGINMGGRNRPGVRWDQLRDHLGRAPRLPAPLVPDLTLTHRPAERADLPLS